MNWLLLLAVFSLCYGQTFFALEKVCEGWFCRTQHLDIISFTFQNPQAPTSIVTIYPSSEYNVIDDLQLLSSYNPNGQTYFCTVTDAQMKTTLWTYSLASNKSSSLVLTPPPSASAPANLNWDNSQQRLLISYTGTGSVWRVDPASGKMTPAFTVFNNPNFVADIVSFWADGPQTFSEIVFNNQDPQNPCYYFYVVPKGSPQTQSVCVPAYSSGSLTNTGTYFAQNITGGYFTVSYNVLGGNYQWIGPVNASTVTTLLDFTDFAGMGWDFYPDGRAFTYNPRTGVLWALISYDSGNDNPVDVMGGVQIPSAKAQVSATLGTGNGNVEWSNFQVVY